MGARGWTVTAAVFAAVVASLWYGQAPPRTVGDYRERAAMTVETVRSQVETARLWVRELDAGNVTRQAAGVALREAERDAAAAAAEFAAWDPPGDTGETRASVTTLAGDATDALAQLRIAAEDGRWEALPALAQPLPQLAERLEALARRVDP